MHKVGGLPDRHWKTALLDYSLFCFYSRKSVVHKIVRAHYGTSSHMGSSLVGRASQLLLISQSSGHKTVLCDNVHVFFLALQLVAVKTVPKAAPRGEKVSPRKPSSKCDF